jgi:sugar O-acyltransferase (sialic acid O-acetyltransferase NeuD family)
VTPRPLLLLGAGGLAREVLAAARVRPDWWLPVGCLDDDPARHGGDVDGIPVLGPTAMARDYPEAAMLACVASPHRPGARIDLVRRLGLPPETFVTLVHPASSIPRGTELGPGTVVLAGTVVTAPQRIGAHVLLMPHCLLTHDDEVADGATLAGRATLAGAVRVGEGAYLGAGALVREQVRIGARAVVGMGSVVLRDVPAGQTWVGHPARPLTRAETTLPQQAHPVEARQ